jgi:hypothetical protein
MTPRYALAVPIAIGDVSGTTRDVGVGGVRFDSPIPFELQQSISFALTVGRPSEAITVRCVGVVQLVEQAGGGFVVDASIDQIAVGQ